MGISAFLQMWKLKLLIASRRYNKILSLYNWFSHICACREIIETKIFWKTPWSGGCLKLPPAISHCKSDLNIHDQSLKPSRKIKAWRSSWCHQQTEHWDERPIIFIILIVSALPAEELLSPSHGLKDSLSDGQRAKKNNYLSRRITFGKSPSEPCFLQSFLAWRTLIAEVKVLVVISFKV